MAFNGYLLKINGIIFPNKYIALDTYISIPNQQTDLDAYTDADGYLHRNVLPHTASKIEFNTPLLDLAKKQSMQSLIPTRVKLILEYWNDEENIYKIGNFYVPSISYSIYRTTEKDIIYNPIRIAFIEY